METTKPAPGAFAQWRLTGIGLLRILFGIVWGVDAWFKWQPDFVSNFTTYLTGAQDGQPWPIHHWIQFWVNTVGIDPTFFSPNNSRRASGAMHRLHVGRMSENSTLAFPLIDRDATYLRGNRLLPLW